MTSADHLAEQLDFHWTHFLRPRLDGLTDGEYFWQPVPNCWTVHPDGSVDFAYPEPDPPPFTTIGWRLAHVIVGVLAVRNHHHFGAPEAGYDTWRYATDAATALRQLDEQYRIWNAGVRGLSDDDLDRPCGQAEGPYAQYPMTDLVLHINRETIHHGAEIACIRDLYRHTNTKGK
ncbi:DinB family protein [Mycobacterium sp. IDR2000157661]|uniref:DinB family protein n=1 Tax=Mycobacterium sp. IDR2000157661 TaxID=2867005 RepID=UPI001EEA2DD7|nr:DinB family protein [Mycobacterium sp. IDR2000157661]ULE33934.1 DinB family protein [Mycobacterium sp. IDR2000157661]